LIESALASSVRTEIIDQALNGHTGGEGLKRLRAGMRAHTFPKRVGKLSLRGVVSRLDQRTRAEGFHVLQGWDPVARRFPEDIAPVLMLDYCARVGIRSGSEREALAILLDYYFLTILSLFAVRAWDQNDPNAALDDVTRLIGSLHGPRGSRCRFVDDAETLLLLAISHYHPEDAAYDALLRKVWQLDETHRLKVAMPGAAILGSHLRWGFRNMYGRDVGRMREDNVVDYPWLLFSVATLVRAYGASRPTGQAVDSERTQVVAHLLNGLTPDPWAFTGALPKAMSGYPVEHAEVSDQLHAHRDALMAAFESHRPDPTIYTPLGFQFNFLPNAVTAMVAITLAGEAKASIGLNRLLAAPEHGSVGQAEQVLAGALMRFAGGSEDRLGSRGSLLVSYDPFDALRSFNAAMRRLAEAPTPRT